MKGCLSLVREGIHVFCIGCNSKVAEYPLPEYMRCRCGYHGVPRYSNYWSEMWMVAAEDIWTGQQNVYHLQTRTARGLLQAIQPIPKDKMVTRLFDTGEFDHGFSDKVD